jgi:predicted transcriptional regulator
VSVLDKLASALGRNDERPNVALAEALAAEPDPDAIRELMGAVAAGSAATRHDAIKVLYELGERRPELFGTADVAAFFATLTSRSNRLVWGGMSALAAVAGAHHELVSKRLPEILAAADKGSVIAKDKAMAILVTLAGKGHAKDVLPILLQRLADAAPNQFPTYAEEVATVMDAAHRPRLIAIIEKRLPKVVGEAKVRRLEKLLRKLAK